MAEPIIAGIALLFALVPAVVYARNVRLYQSPALPERRLSAVSILIPARNEERSLPAALKAALGSRGIDFEIVVLDDHSEDATAAIVQGFAERDPRVRLERAPALPAGWCGKQHACWTLAQRARYPILCFIDADVQMAPEGAARMVGFLESSTAGLVSGFPLQHTVTFLERLVIPLIHFLLLGFLPLSRMRRSADPRFGAGCGQLFVARRDAYEKCGGHESVKASLHDGLTLPRAFRTHGFKTDVCDGAEIAVCRMYRSGSELWAGLAKNAREGLAATKLIVPATVMLLLGQVAPMMLFLFFVSKFAVLIYFKDDSFIEMIEAYQRSGLGVGLALASVAMLVSYYPRVDAALRFRQPMESAFLHPFGVIILLAIQWYAAFRAIFGRPNNWRGRSYLPS